MRVRSLGSSLVFAAAAAIAAPFTQHVFSPVVGTWSAFAFHLGLCGVAYAAMLGRTMRASLRNALVAAAGAGAVFALTRGPMVGMGEVAIGLTLVLALVRSGLDSGGRRGRAILLEAVLGVMSLAVAGWLASPGWLGGAMALWGYGLVQSLYFMFPESQRSSSGEDGVDPFDRARDRILSMLGEA